MASITSELVMGATGPWVGAALVIGGWVWKFGVVDAARRLFCALEYSRALCIQQNNKESP